MICLDFGESSFLWSPLMDSPARCEVMVETRCVTRLLRRNDGPSRCYPPRLLIVRYHVTQINDETATGSSTSNPHKLIILRSRRTELITHYSRCILTAVLVSRLFTASTTDQATTWRFGGRAATGSRCGRSTMNDFPHLLVIRVMKYVRGIRLVAKVSESVQTVRLNLQYTAKHSQSVKIIVIRRWATTRCQEVPSSQ